MKESNTQTGIPFKVYSLLMPSDPLWPWTRIQYLLKMNQDLKKKKKMNEAFYFGERNTALWICHYYNVLSEAQVSPIHSWHLQTRAVKMQSFYKLLV